MTNAKKKQEQDRKSRVKKKQEGQKLQKLPGKILQKLPEQKLQKLPEQKLQKLPEEKLQRLPAEKLQKLPAEKQLETPENKINRNIKDSVFCDLFGMPEYLMQLYKVLHPDDTETTEDDLTIVTLSRTVARNIYNDLGFLVRNRLLVLVEAQSTWSENILVRFLMYLGETYRRYIKTKGLRIYSEKNVDIPKPELYLVFTGKVDDIPETISLKESFFGGEDSCVDITAKVICESGQGDILNQYITFSRVFDEQLKLYPGDREKIVMETIRVCKDKNVLKDYLAREEAAAIMFTIADQAEAMKEALEMERAEGKAEGLAEGKAEGLAEGEGKLAALMKKLLSLGRMEDLQKATTDQKYREIRYTEFKIS